MERILVIWFLYKAVGIRLDSGDLAYQSCEARKFFCAIEKEFNCPDFAKMSITASNDLNEETIDALNKQPGILIGALMNFTSSRKRLSQERDHDMPSFRLAPILGSQIVSAKGLPANSSKPSSCSFAALLMSKNYLNYVSIAFGLFKRISKGKV
ncbi:hypothetical protein LIER_42346 [Lithospermum erythrorhizon]|uniref:nicotinate phosphoribosyltransferase n=1 Tax=Lithospermum erythrorhizon TaxID=34254 RepID=A0AAV3RU26_LITER